MFSLPTVPLSKNDEPAVADRQSLAALCARSLAPDPNEKGALKQARATLQRWLRGKTGDWDRCGRKTLRWLKGGELAFNVFVEGNSKLPFWGFSTLPIFTCPGAGACADWCYSFKAWARPGAFFRQYQNTLLLRSRPDVIEEEFNKLPQNATLRLYVDGDFACLGDVSLWCSLLISRPDLRAYGYSKSWDLLLAHPGPWPPNYKLNLSSGGQSVALESQLYALPVTRGRFLTLATRLPKMGGKGRYKDKTYLRALKAEAAALGLRKTFPCPGDCGACTSKGPLCALDATATVVIGKH